MTVENSKASEKQALNRVELLASNWVSASDHAHVATSFRNCGTCSCSLGTSDISASPPKCGCSCTSRVVPSARAIPGLF
eukprot:5571110-Pleurochrysis_carterae.AAC.1